MSRRISSHAIFWEERFVDTPGLFGYEPNAFVAEHAHLIESEASVLELGAGEGRNAVFLAEARGADVTAFDFSPEALQSATRLANERNVSITTKVVDLRQWLPQSNAWDAIIMTFVQLLPEERERLYRGITEALRPGGVLLGVWFHPEHLREEYARIGPSRADRLVTADEIRGSFPHVIELCEEVEVILNEGPMLQGRAALTQAVFRKGARDAKLR